MFESFAKWVKANRAQTTIIALVFFIAGASAQQIMSIWGSFTTHETRISKIEGRSDTWNNIEGKVTQRMDRLADRVNDLEDIAARVQVWIEVISGND